MNEVNKIKGIIIGILLLGVVMGAAITVTAMDEGDEAPKPETQYDQGAENTEHETERLRPNGTGDECPKEDS